MKKQIDFTKKQNILSMLQVLDHEQIQITGILIWRSSLWVSYSRLQV